MLPTGRYRVVQLHPTLKCNLRCLHCYSDSGPTATTALPLDIASRLVTDAASEGYEVLAVSGGEPLLYDGLPTVLDVARRAGMGTAVTTNGTLLTPSRLGPLEGLLDLLAISLDGTPASHDRIRNSRSAFARLERNLSTVRDQGTRFGFIFTLTQSNVHELEWVARFALEQGASLLQIHPLELAGRASVDMIEEHPDTIELGFAFAEALCLRALAGDRMHVHLDVATRSGIEALSRAAGEHEPEVLSDAISPLVVEADGTVVPLTYGFPREYSLGNLYEAPLNELGPKWFPDGHHRLRSLVSALEGDQVWSRRLPLLNLYETAVAIANDRSSATLRPRRLDREHPTSPRGAEVVMTDTTDATVTPSRSRS